MRSTARVHEVSLNTVAKLLREAGRGCAAHHDAAVQNVTAQRIQADEIWAFCYAKRGCAPYVQSPWGHAGDVWTWTAIDPDTKLMISYLGVGRGTDDAKEFISDLEGRVVNRPQLTTDAHGAYLVAVEEVFGSEIDYAQVTKVYGKAIGEEPPRVMGSSMEVIAGNADERFISTSLVERHNLSLRMQLRCFIRRTNGFSRWVEQHRNALALYFTWYNFVWVHGTIGKTPTMAAGLAERPMDPEEIVELADR